MLYSTEDEWANSDSLKIRPVNGKWIWHIIADVCYQANVFNFWHIMFSIAYDTIYEYKMWNMKSAGVSWNSTNSAMGTFDIKETIMGS